MRFTKRELRLLGTDTDRAIAARLGRTVRSVERARARRGIPGYRFGKGRKVNWSKWGRLLGRIPDCELAGRIGCSQVNVTRQRNKRGIAAHSAH